MRNIACIIARTSSSRLPGKVLKDINGLKLIEYLVEKIKKSKNVHEIYICTSTEKSDLKLIEFARNIGVKSYRGSLESVIERMISVGNIENADNVIRITGDNVFTDEIYLDIMIEEHIKKSADYTRTEFLPLGITSEVIKLNALKKCEKEINPSDSQYLLFYMFQPYKYKCLVLIPEKKHQLPKISFTVDTFEDLNQINLITKGTDKNVLTLDEIIKRTRKQKILKEKKIGLIKFPSNIVVSYDTFRCEMEFRINNSEVVHVKKGEYNKRIS